MGLVLRINLSFWVKIQINLFRFCVELTRDTIVKFVIVSHWIFLLKLVFLVYIDVFDATERKIFLTVIGNGNEARGFRIKVTQLIERQAPPDCLQYYEGTTGMIKTFNYDEISRVVRRKFASYFVSITYLAMLWLKCSNFVGLWGNWRYFVNDLKRNKVTQLFFLIFHIFISSTFCTSCTLFYHLFLFNFFA